jgi:hypothetical protein
MPDLSGEEETTMSLDVEALRGSFQLVVERSPDVVRRFYAQERAAGPDTDKTAPLST